MAQTIPGLGAPLAGVSQLSVAFVTSGTTTGTTISWPAVQADDIAIIHNYAKSNTNPPSYVTPTGFTLIGRDQDTGLGDCSGVMSYRQCTGSETGSITLMNGGVTNGSIIFIFRPSRACIVTIFDVGAEGNQGDPASQTVTVTGFLAPMIISASAGFSSLFDPGAAFSTQSPAFTATVGVAACKACYKIYNPGDTPASHTVDKNDQGVGNWLGSFGMQLS